MNNLTATQHAICDSVYTLDNGVKAKDLNQIQADRLLGQLRPEQMAGALATMPTVVDDLQTLGNEQPEADEFDEMNVADLREYAKNNGVDLGGITKKSDILAAVRATDTEGNLLDGD